MWGRDEGGGCEFLPVGLPCCLQAGHAALPAVRADLEGTHRDLPHIGCKGIGYRVYDVYNVIGVNIYEGI